jgi:hypothetical protein
MGRRVLRVGGVSLLLLLLLRVLWQLRTAAVLLSVLLCLCLSLLLLLLVRLLVDRTSVRCLWLVSLQNGMAGVLRSAGVCGRLLLIPTHWLM